MGAALDHCFETGERFIQAREARAREITRFLSTWQQLLKNEDEAHSALLTAQAVVTHALAVGLETLTAEESEANEKMQIRDLKAKDIIDEKLRGLRQYTM